MPLSLVAPLDHPTSNLRSIVLNTVNTQAHLRPSGLTLPLGEATHSICRALRLDNEGV
jgi:hypothetical protein